ncbi:MAG TPA: hypothetical protein VGP57_02645 [Actinoplanes sp.]|nr:hypothetical protein [Actinoplanes sp.]
MDSPPDTIPRALTMAFPVAGTPGWREDGTEPGRDLAGRLPGPAGGADNRRRG